MTRGPKPVYAIQLAADEAEHLRRLVRAHSTPHAQVLRAHIVLAAHDHPDWTNQQIAHTLATSDRMVRTWRRRWHDTRTITDAPRSGAPRRCSP
jgi:Winged helix-turn helix